MSELLELVATEDRDVTRANAARVLDCVRQIEEPTRESVREQMLTLVRATAERAARQGRDPGVAAVELVRLLAHDAAEAARRGADNCPPLMAWVVIPACGQKRPGDTALPCVEPHEHDTDHRDSFGDTWPNAARRRQDGGHG